LQFSEFYTRPDKPTISFEVFPPKTEDSFVQLQEVVSELTALSPDFMTVTYGAFGSTRERTIDIASLIQNKFSLPAASHLTCVGSSQEELNQILQEIHRSGIRNIVALRGDPPKGETEFKAVENGFAHANELVRHIRRYEREAGLGRFGIAVAGYPEKHLEAVDFETDLLNLKRKVEAGADCVITQLFYDNAVYFRFVEAARRMGITVPIVPGLLPIVSAKQIVRITSLCGACLPGDLKLELESVGDDQVKAEEIGVRRTISQAKELLEKGVPGIHFYVLNKSSHMVRIMKKIAGQR
jgi:methylenetetrahydrofolate reductase (NADPH)